MTTQNQKLHDFTFSKYSAVLSDLHVSEAEPEPRKHPLWKKFKTSEFFFDAQFEQFLIFIQEKVKSGPHPEEKIELILNGDIFDFDAILSSPEGELFRVSWIERLRGIFPQPDKSEFKMKVIIRDHLPFFKALHDFLKQGHRVIFIIGNHDVELHYPEVQKQVLQALQLNPEEEPQVRFVEWFYISNKDTLVEHGNQYDPYCLFEDPIHPYVQRYNYISMKLPFGNLACRYIMNGMGFFNPHAEANYIMSLKEYLIFFFKYIIRIQPLLAWTWFWGAIATLVHATVDRFAHPVRNPLIIEERIEEIAHKANATPKIVRQLRELFVVPASNNPLLIARELWLDRAFLLVFLFLFACGLTLVLKTIFDISLFWALVPLALTFPLFIFYSKSVRSLVSVYKEPNDKTLLLESEITGAKRIIYGHTHIVRHEFRGPVEHLNSGTWSPAFSDVECNHPLDQKTFIWISPQDEGLDREAQVFKFKDGKIELAK